MYARHKMYAQCVSFITVMYFLFKTVSMPGVVYYVVLLYFILNFNPTCVSQ